MRRLQRLSLPLLLLLILTLLSLFSTRAAAQCGVERWSVKTGTDSTVGLVNLNSTTPTTIAQMIGLTPPNPLPPDTRVPPNEATVWVINATLTMYKLESDSDYHLILQDSSGNTMISEIPAPSCVGSGSPFLPGITNARSQMDAKFTVTTSFQTANIPVQVTGVGFFDFLHGQTGVAPNGIELHPVLDIQFNPTADFSIGSSPGSISVAQGSSGTSTISTTVSGGFSSAVSLSASGMPSGVTASFNPSSIPAPGSGSSILTLTVGSSVAAGTYPITVTGSGGGNSHTTTVSLTVTQASNPDFTISASPSTLSLVQGSSGTSTVTTTVGGGFNSTVVLSASGMPSGVTASFNPSSIPAPGSGSSTLTVTVGSPVAVGTYPITVTGTGGGKTHSTTVSLTVTQASKPDFTIGASPSSLTIVQGASGASTITITSQNGFNSATTLSTSALPSGVTASFSPNPVTPPANGSVTSTLTLSASSTAAVGTTTVTVTGTSGTLSHSTAISLTVSTLGGGQTAIYSSTLKAPECATVGISCDSGPTLLLGRDNMSGGAEPNQPNTINNSCADGTSGTFHSSESNDRLVVATTDGSSFAAGKTVMVTATVWAYGTGSTNALDLYYAANASSPSWVYITTIVPSAGGAQTLSASYTLPIGSLQAVRANFRYQGSPSSCSTGAYDDHDDLVFAVH